MLTGKWVILCRVQEGVWRLWGESDSVARDGVVEVQSGWG